MQKVRVRLRWRWLALLMILLLLAGVGLWVLPNAESLQCRLLSADGQFWNLAQLYWTIEDDAVFVLAGDVYYASLDGEFTVYERDQPEAEALMQMVQPQVDPAFNAKYSLEQTFRRGTRIVLIRDLLTDEVLVNFSDATPNHTAFTWTLDGEAVILPFQQNFEMMGMTEIDDGGLVLLRVGDANPQYFRDINALPNTAMIYSRFTWSPDGKTLVFLRRQAGQTFGEEIGAITLDDEIIDIQTRTDLRSPLLWLSNSAFLIFIYDGKMQLLDAKTGYTREYIDGWLPALSSDRQRLAYLTGSRCQPELIIADTNGNNARRLAVLERQ